MGKEGLQRVLNSCMISFLSANGREEKVLEFLHIFKITDGTKFVCSKIENKQTNLLIFLHDGPWMKLCILDFHALCL